MRDQMSGAARTIVCFGPGPQFKGGISDYNTSLALALDKEPGTDVQIVSWTQQYPAIIPRKFVDETSSSDALAGSGVEVTYITNYNNPLTWRSTYRHITALQPEKVIFQWSIAIQGPPLGYLIKRLSRHPDIEVVVDLHFVVQKENSLLDERLTRWGIRHADTYLVHAEKTFDELQELYPDRSFELISDGGVTGKSSAADTSGAASAASAASVAPAAPATPATPVLKLFHPVYDLFEPQPDFDVEAFKRQHGLREHVFLFFGFIRKYKGLHNAIRAFARVAAQRDDVSLLICGESFWKTLDERKWSTRLKTALFGMAKALFLKKEADEGDYRPLELIDELGIQDQTVVFNSFIPNEDVHKYFQSSDAVVLYYLRATPSGIESLSYNFELPILASRVGHFPETVRDGVDGFLAEPGDIDSMAQQMIHAIEHPIPPENIRRKTKEMSWTNYARAILQK